MVTTCKLQWDARKGSCALIDMSKACATGQTDDEPTVSGGAYALFIRDWFSGGIKAVRNRVERPGGGGETKILAQTDIMGEPL